MKKKIDEIVPKAPVADPPVIGRGTQYFYGRVNYWNCSAKLLKQEVELMRKRGVTGYIIEMAGWGSENMRKPATSEQYKEWVTNVAKYYKYLHNLCVENGLWLFVGIVNDNALSSKHGNKPVDPKHYYGTVAKNLLKVILKCGPSNVIVQPISELYVKRVKDHPGPSFQKKAVVKLKEMGFLTCNNDAYGRPTKLGGCNYVAWHPDSIRCLPEKLNKAKTLLVSDTGGIISELNGGVNCDKMDADCKPSKVKEWKKNCAGYAVVGYYDFKRKKYNEAAIKAMGTK